MPRIVRVGTRVSKKHLIKGEDVKAFGDIINDHNPIHSDPKAAEAAGFSAPICYGMLTGSLISGLLATDIPGPNSVYLSQSFKFLAPVLIGEEVEMIVEVLQFRKDKGLISLRTTIQKENPKGGAPIVCVQGNAVCMNKLVEFDGESEWTPSK